MKHSFLTICVLSLFSPCNAAAENIEYYLSILDSHPSVQRVLEEKEALVFEANGALGLPDPVVSLGVENIPIADPSFDQYLPSSKTIGFSQNIPNPARRTAQKVSITNPPSCNNYLQTIAVPQVPSSAPEWVRRPDASIVDLTLVHGFQ